MELDKNESDELWLRYTNKKLIGTGSNGNRVYTVENRENHKVKLN